MKTKKEILEEAGYVPITGRPKTGNICLPKLTVPLELKAAMEKKAERTGKSVPEARRAAYKAYIGGGHDRQP